MLAEQGAVRVPVSRHEPAVEPALTGLGGRASLPRVPWERSPDDGRGWNAVLTETGLQRLRQTWPAHLAIMRRHVLDHLQAADLPALTAALQRFATDAPHTDPNTAP